MIEIACFIPTLFEPQRHAGTELHKAFLMKLLATLSWRFIFK